MTVRQMTVAELRQALVRHRPNALVSVGLDDLGAVVATYVPDDDANRVVLVLDGEIADD